MLYGAHHPEGGLSPDQLLQAMYDPLPVCVGPGKKTTAILAATFDWTPVRIFGGCWRKRLDLLEIPELRYLCRLSGAGTGPGDAFHLSPLWRRGRRNSRPQAFLTAGIVFYENRQDGGTAGAELGLKRLDVEAEQKPATKRWLRRKRPLEISIAIDYTIPRPLGWQGTAGAWIQGGAGISGLGYSGGAGRLRVAQEPSGLMLIATTQPQLRLKSRK